MADDPMDAVAAVADAVLFEGYLLYPYRASAQKNALRWQFGVLVPPATSTALAEPSRSRTECVLDPRPGATLRLRLRFLAYCGREVLDADGRPVERLVVDGEPHLSWDEGIPRQVDATVVLDALPGHDTPHAIPVEHPPTVTVEEIVDAAGTVRGHYRRRTAALRGRVLVSTEELPGPYGARRLRLDVVNDADGVAPDAPRDEALAAALISAHTVLHLDAGAFLSCAAPPEWAAPAVAGCTQEHSWPVLAGESLLLASPIILADDPQLAPESPTDLFDGTENDEILSLRTLALTEDEKREARATDPRAARIVDAIDAMGPEMFERLHGVIRPDGRAPDTVPTLITPELAGATAMPEAPWWDPGADASVEPETDAVLVDDVLVARGSSVVLRPGRGERSDGGNRGSDAQDLFLDGATATVAAVLRDVDGGTHVAVTVDGDPAAELQIAHGRYRYFRPSELAPATTGVRP